MSTATEPTWQITPEKVKAVVERLIEVARPKKIILFGSYVRAELSRDSDLDVLVDLEPGRSLLDQVAFQQELEDLLGRPVDVVVEGGISPYLEPYIRAEATPL